MGCENAYDNLQVSRTALDYIFVSIATKMSHWLENCVIIYILYCPVLKKDAFHNNRLISDMILVDCSLSRKLELLLHLEFKWWWELQKISACLTCRMKNWLHIMIDYQLTMTGVWWLIRREDKVFLEDFYFCSLWLIRACILRKQKVVLIFHKYFQSVLLLFDLFE